MKKPNSIRDILVKAVARDIRKLYPLLRVEGHPSYSESAKTAIARAVTAGTTVARLIISKNKTTSISIRFSSMVKRNREQIADNEVMITAKIRKDGNWLPWHGTYINNDKCPHFLKLDLVSPDSIDKLELWIAELIEEYLDMKKASPMLP